MIAFENLDHDFEALRATARFLLQNAARFEWSLQGLGMFRLRIDESTRLHIWDLRFRTPGASPIHDHLQWSLRSVVLSGCIRNVRYVEDVDGPPFNCVTLKAGYGCHFLGEPKQTRLWQGKEEVYAAGMQYIQRPEEIHETIPEDGTVTVVRQQRTGTDGARVFWPAGEKWGSAEPRQATRVEVEEIVAHALKLWGRA